MTVGRFQLFRLFPVSAAHILFYITRIVFITL
jgi:hypothetical protein